MKTQSISQELSISSAMSTLHNTFASWDRKKTAIVAIAAIAALGLTLAIVMNHANSTHSALPVSSQNSCHHLLQKGLTAREIQIAHPGPNSINELPALSSSDYKLITSFSSRINQENHLTCRVQLATNTAKTLFKKIISNKSLTTYIWDDGFCRMGCRAKVSIA